MFLKVTSIIIRTSQTKLEYVKSNADNSAELICYSGFDSENHLRQIDQEHQIFMINLCNKLLDFKTESSEVKSPKNQGNFITAPFS